MNIMWDPFLIDSAKMCLIIYFQVKDEIENLLDDDDDMAELFLTDKLAQHHYPNSSVSSINNADDVENLQVPQPNINDRYIQRYKLEYVVPILVEPDFVTSYIIKAKFHAVHGSYHNTCVL